MCTFLKQALSTQSGFALVLGLRYRLCFSAYRARAEGTFGTTVDKSIWSHCQPWPLMPRLRQRGVKGTPLGGARNAQTISLNAWIGNPSGQGYKQGQKRDVGISDNYKKYLLCSVTLTVLFWLKKHILTWLGVAFITGRPTTCAETRAASPSSPQALD